MLIECQDTPTISYVVLDIKRVGIGHGPDDGHALARDEGLIELVSSVHLPLELYHSVAALLTAAIGQYIIRSSQLNVLEVRAVVACAVLILDCDTPPRHRSYHHISISHPLRWLKAHRDPAIRLALDSHTEVL